MKRTKIKTMKMIYWALLVMPMLILASCNGLFLDQDSVIENEVTDIKDLTAPSDFSWKTSQSVSIAVDVLLASEFKSKVLVYNANPNEGGELLQTGSASNTETYVSEVSVPSYLNSLYLVCEFPTGIKVKADVAIAEGTLLYTFSESSNEQLALRTVSVAPDCSTGCSREVSGNVNKLTIEGGETVCLTGALQGNLTFRNGGGTLRICGSAIIQNVNFNGHVPEANFVITESGLLQSHNINLNSSDYTIINWGVFNHSSNLSIPGVFKNYGVANINGFNVNQNGVLENYSEFNVSGHMNNNSIVLNYGAIEVTGHYNNNGQSRLDNYCQMIVNDNFAQNKVMNNYGYIYCGAGFRVNGGTANEMYSGAMIKCTDIHIDSYINGNGSTSGIAVANKTFINGSGALTGALDICDDNGIEHNNGVIEASVTFCEAYIPTTSCNPAGYGEAPVLEDADNDGVIDSQDEFPNDEHRAFTSYFISKNGTASILFEDLWPSTGDYDFNDLVLGVSGIQVLNSDNKVVEIFLDFKVRAVGAANINGFGLQLSELVSSSVESVSGAVYGAESAVSLQTNGTEDAQSNAVVVVVEDVEDLLNRSAGAMFNTVKNGYTGTSDLVQLHIVFGENTPIDNSLITFSDLDVFLICNQDRGWEVHAADVVPTGLMADLWGHADDTSNPSAGRYFKTDNNLPWALVIVDDFRYPIEKVSILDAYPQFKDWVQSGGTLNQDWYQNPVESNIW